MNTYTLSTKLASLTLMSLLLFALSFQVMAGSGALVTTNQLQVLVSPSNGGLFYANTGSGIVSNPATVVPAGSTFLLVGSVFPAGTYDVFGNALTTPKSVGQWRCTGTRIVAYGVTAPFPASNTVLEQADESLVLNGFAGQNSIYSKGFLVSANNPNLTPGVVGATSLQTILAGSGLNILAFGNISIAAYVTPIGILENLSFSFPVTYVSP